MPAALAGLDTGKWGALADLGVGDATFPAAFAGLDTTKLFSGLDTTKLFASPDGGGFAGLDATKFFAGLDTSKVAKQAFAGLQPLGGIGALDATKLFAGLDASTVVQQALAGLQSSGGIAGLDATMLFAGLDVTGLMNQALAGLDASKVFGGIDPSDLFDNIDTDALADVQVDDDGAVQLTPEQAAAFVALACATFLLTVVGQRIAAVGADLAEEGMQTLWFLYRLRWAFQTASPGTFLAVEVGDVVLYRLVRSAYRYMRREDEDEPT
jgi:hypothetical protein